MLSHSPTFCPSRSTRRTLSTDSPRPFPRFLFPSPSLPMPLLPFNRGTPASQWHRTTACRKSVPPQHLRPFAVPCDQKMRPRPRSGDIGKRALHSIALPGFGGVVRLVHRPVGQRTRPGDDHPVEFKPLDPVHGGKPHSVLPSVLRRIRPDDDRPDPLCFQGGTVLLKDAVRPRNEADIPERFAGSLQLIQVRR